MKENAPVEVLLGAVAGSEVVEGGTDIDSLGLLEGALLDEGAEGSRSGAETSHDNGRGVRGGELTVG